MSKLTVLNAGRKYLGLDSLAGKAYLTSGLGGMSGAQAKVKFEVLNICLRNFHSKWMVPSLVSVRRHLWLCGYNCRGQSGSSAKTAATRLALRDCGWFGLFGEEGSWGQSPKGGTCLTVWTDLIWEGSSLRQMFIQANRKTTLFLFTQVHSFLSREWTR